MAKLDLKGGLDRPLSVKSICDDGSLIEFEYKEVAMIFDLKNRILLTQPEDRARINKSVCEISYTVYNNEGTVVYHQDGIPVMSQTNIPYFMVVGNGGYAYKDGDFLVIDDSKSQETCRIKLETEIYSAEQVISGPIIPKALFYRVQEEEARRGSMHKPAVARKAKEEKSKYSSKYALSEILICGECGHPYRGQTWSKNGRKSAVWRCESRLKAGTKNSRNSPTLKEVPLHEAIMKAVNRVVENQGEFVGAFRENVVQVIGSHSTKDVATEYDGQIEELQQQLMGLIEENARQGAVDEDFNERYREIAEEIRGLKVKKLKMVQEQKLAV